MDDISLKIEFLGCHGFSFYHGPSDDYGSYYHSEVEDISISLKKLSSITKEDLIAIGIDYPPEVIEIYPENRNYQWEAKRMFGHAIGGLSLKDFDYLRDKGYALPWRGISVKKQIEYGWITIKK